MPDDLHFVLSYQGDVSEQVLAFDSSVTLTNEDIPRENAPYVRGLVFLFDEPILTEDYELVWVGEHYFGSQAIERAHSKLSGLFAHRETCESPDECLYSLVDIEILHGHVPA